MALRKKGKRKLNSKKIGGFTILELIVVIALIATLSAVAMVQYSDAQAKSRDATRISNVREIEKALNLYFVDNHVFPISTEKITITGEDSLSTALEDGGHIIETPSDPMHPTYTYTYQSNSSGTDYDITFCMETSSISIFEEGCENSVSP